MRTRKPLEYIVRRYDRVAPLYNALEPLFGILPMARRKAVRALRLKPGDAVLEIGAGTGRNLPDLVEAVGPNGKVVALDASRGMLEQARQLVSRRAWRNVELVQQDAAHLTRDQLFDGVLFSLSYSVLPDPRPVLERAWELLRPAARVVIMDAGITETPLRAVLAPLTRLLLQLGPGDPYSRPWEDLASYGPVTIERFLLNVYFVCSVEKPVTPSYS